MKRLIRRISLGLVLATLTGCPDEATPYTENDLELATAYTAKELCSCLFVMELEESACRAWTRASPEVTVARIHKEEKRVETSALTLWGAKARFVDERTGCVIE